TGVVALENSGMTQNYEKSPELCGAAKLWPPNYKQPLHHKTSIAVFMNGNHCSAAGVIQFFECFIPFQGNRRRAGYRRNRRYRSGSSFTGEMLFEDAPVAVFFFILRSVQRKSEPCTGHHFIGYFLLSALLQRINP